MQSQRLDILVKERSITVARYYAHGSFEKLAGSYCDHIN